MRPLSLFQNPLFGVLHVMIHAESEQFPRTLRKGSLRGSGIQRSLQTHSRLSGRYQLPIELLHILSPPSTLALALTRTVKYCVQNGLLSVQH